MISGSTLSGALDNTSPILLDDLSGPDAPAITEFGINLENTSTLDLNSWILTAFNDPDDASPVTIGSNSIAGILGATQAGVDADFFPQADDGINGGRLHSDVSWNRIHNRFFTTPFSTLVFDGAPILELLTGPDLNCGSGQGQVDCSSYVRYQAVGTGGSLTLSGTPGNGNDNGTLPEPATHLLMGLGLLGLLLARRYPKF
jgi:PEP-CTERM motif